MEIIMSWKFDSTVAKTFTEHARQHIPNYSQVIDQCVDICKQQDKSIKIIDVGCAVGETLKRLHSSGFDNLYGVDNSQSMLDKCPQDIATLYCSDYLPKGPYDVILMNWTLHFVKDKLAYLKEIYTNLNHEGILVISEKTSLDKTAIDFYHNYKRKQGVSDADIRSKEISVKNIMYIDNIEWYQQAFKSMGFSKIYIVNAFWCFTTFVCIK
jgi:tRNA (cmo5U34)-methyltransferase